MTTHEGQHNPERCDDCAAIRYARGVGQYPDLLDWHEEGTLFDWRDPRGEKL